MSKLAKAIENNHFLMALYEVGCQASRVFNFMFGGSLDETFSFRVAKNEHDCKVCKAICKIIHFLDPGHCPHAIEWWKEHGSYMKDHRPLWTWALIWSVVVYLVVF